MECIEVDVISVFVARNSRALVSLELSPAPRTQHHYRYESIIFLKI